MKNVIVASVAGIALYSASAALAQDTDDGTDPETAEETSNGAIVTREDIVEDRVDEDGNPIPVLDDDGNQVLDEEGNPVFETDTVGFVQTVETPSGNFHQVTKVDGSRAIVTHEFANKPERFERVERAERPEKPERPDRPDKPDRPGRD